MSEHTNLPEDLDLPKDLDLTTTDPLPEPELVSYGTPDYDPDPERERLRGWIAMTLVGLLVGIIVLSFIVLWGKWVAIDDLKSFLEIVFAPVIALVASATGFYFGGRAK